MKTNKGKLAKRTRLIKQDIDSKGKILKSSRVVEVKSYEVQFREIRHEFNHFRLLTYAFIAVLIILLIMWR